MRTALLAALKRTDDGALCAELQLCGQSVLAWQVTLALKLGCERIICLCDAPGTDLLSVQGDVEEDGLDFHAIRSLVQLTALLRADDELVVVLDGLVIEPSVAVDVALSEGKLRKGVFSLDSKNSSQNSENVDFERIDAERLWAGLIIMHAAPVQQLANLPPDSDAASLLLRLALQTGTDCVPLAPEHVSKGDWLLASSQALISGRQKVLIDEALPRPPWFAPSTALTIELIRKLAPSTLQSGPIWGALSAVLLALAGVVLVAFGFSATGVLIGAAAAMASIAGATLAHMRKTLFDDLLWSKIGRHLSALIDVLAALSLALAVWMADESASLVAMPLIAIGTARIAERLMSPSSSAFWSDRPLQLAVFAVCAILGLLSEGLAVFTLAAVAQMLLHRRQMN